MSARVHWCTAASMSKRNGGEGGEASITTQVQQLSMTINNRRPTGHLQGDVSTQRRGG